MNVSFSSKGRIASFRSRRLLSASAMMSIAAVTLFLLLVIIGLPIAMSMGLAAGAVIWWFDMPLAEAIVEEIRANAERGFRHGGKAA